MLIEEILPLPHPYVLAVVQGLGCARFSASTVGPCEEKGFLGYVGLRSEGLGFRALIRVQRFKV